MSFKQVCDFLDKLTPGEIEILKLKLNGVNRSTKKNKPKLSVECLHCGRSFIKKLHHKCNTGYRKRNHKWLELTDD